MTDPIRYFLAQIKGIDKEARTLTAVASFLSIDRDNEVILPKAFDLGSFKDNPVIMAGHTYHTSDGSPTVIGKALSIQRKKDQLVFKMEFADTDLAEEYWKLYSGGFMRAFSVGFIPFSGGWETDKEKIRELLSSAGANLDLDSIYRVYTKVELIEISAVAIPSNRESLVMASAKGIDLAGKMLDDLFGKEWGEDAYEIRHRLSDTADVIAFPKKYGWTVEKARQWVERITDLEKYFELTQGSEAGEVDKSADACAVPSSAPEQVSHSDQDDDGSEGDDGKAAKEILAELKSLYEKLAAKEINSVYSELLGLAGRLEASNSRASAAG